MQQHLMKEEFIQAVFDDFENVYISRDKGELLEFVPYDTKTNTVGNGEGIGIALRRAGDNHTTVLLPDLFYEQYCQNSDLKNISIGLLADYLFDDYRSQQASLFMDIDEFRFNEDEFYEAIAEELAVWAVPYNIILAKKIAYDPATNSVGFGSGEGFALQLEGDDAITVVKADGWYKEYCRLDRVPAVDNFARDVFRNYIEKKNCCTTCSNDRRKRHIARK